MREIANVLRERGLQVWLHEFNLRGNLAKGIIEGLQASEKVVVFITYRYLQRSRNPDNNCTKEFMQATKKGVDKLIPVVLDDSVLDPKSWFGTCIEFELGSQTPFDFTSPERVQQNLASLEAEIRRVVCNDT